MADIVTSVVSAIAGSLVAPVIREGKYFLCVNEIIKDLENEKEQLTSERDNLQDRVERAKERTEVIEKPVEKWLSDVTKLLEEVADLEQRMRANNNCFPTCRRYRLCKQMVNKIEAMGKFKGKSNIQPFSHPDKLPGIQYQSSENFTYCESTKVISYQLLEALQDDYIYMIGVYGMGGSGKTTLVTEVGKKVEELNLFDMVISVTISQTPNIRNIQGKIADELGLKLEEETEEGRAQRLWLSLKDKERILVIVDDLWAKFNLRDIGICLDNDYKGKWKVIVTTRRQEICNSMDCQKKIHMSLLSTDESWILFQKRANIDNAFSKLLNDVPQELCRECNGLPIAITAIASSLKGKTNKFEWEAALHNLKHSEAVDEHVEEGARAAMSCLKLSYDYLKNRETELLFLMCSMFPEDYLISIEVLTRYAIGLGLGGRFSLESARCQIVAAINKLLDSCLLMHDEKWKNYVKMHDIVRDVALWIAKRSENHKILVNVDKPLTALAEDDSMRDCFAVSSWYVEDQISIQLDAPALEILLLNTRSDELFDLSHANFEGIEGLKVFHLTNNYYSRRLSLSFPQSILLLTNLKTLRLTNWYLGDMSFIASLTRLEVLDLEGCRFNELPNEMGKLRRLKLLDLSRCYVLQENYNGAIGKCSQLEEFYAAELRTYNPQIVVDIGTLPKLQKFVIYSVSSIIPYRAPLEYKRGERRRVLELNNINISNFKAAEKNLLQIADTTRLVNLHGGCKNFVPDLIGAVGGMSYLTDLRLLKCAEIESIFDATSHSEVDALIPRLVELWLSNLENLKELYQGPPLQLPCFFETLEKLYIFNCHQLHNIFPRECKIPNLKILTIENRDSDDSKLQVLFSMSIAQSLQKLERLTIRCCKELKHIIASEREHGSTTNQEIVPAPRNSHSVMPSLKQVNIYDCSKLECVFPIRCVEGHARLQSVRIERVPELKYVFGECDLQDISSQQHENHIMFPHFEVLDLVNLQNLVGICPQKYRAKWPSPGKLTVDDCPKFVL